MADSPAQAASDVVDVQILSNGRRLDDQASIISIETRAAMNGVPEAVFVVADGDFATQEFPLTDGTSLVAGAKIEIKAGYGGGELKTIFAGRIVKTRLRFDADRPFQLEVSCRDEAYRLTLGRKSAVYSGKTDSEVIASILSDAGLASHVDPTGMRRSALVRHACTDFDFILARAEANGLLVFSASGKVSVMAPDFSAAPALTATFGTDLMSFDGEIDARTQFASARATAWSPDSQAAIAETADVAPGSAWGNQPGRTLAEVGDFDAWTTSTAANLGHAELRALAGARQTRAALARLRGRARFQGSAKAVLGGALELAGIGDRFSGTGLICGVSHRIEAGAWTTEATLGLDAAWLTDRRDIGPPAAAGLNGPARGLQIGKVVEVAEDPEDAARIQVRLPLFGDNALVWARLGGLYASSGFDAVFLPEVDDEVIVAFLNEDPSEPVILGSLYSKGRRPPDDASAKMPSRPGRHGMGRR